VAPASTSIAATPSPFSTAIAPGVNFSMRVAASRGSEGFASTMRASLTRTSPSKNEAIAPRSEGAAKFQRSLKPPSTTTTFGLSRASCAGSRSAICARFCAGTPAFSTNQRAPPSGAGSIACRICSSRAG
jgi:hypothetical protein